MTGDERVEGRTRWQLRAARASDVPQVAAIEAEAFTDPWSFSSFRSLVSGGLVWFRVAVDDDTDQVIGYILVWFAADEAELANIAVAPAMRGQGVGAALLDEALSAAEERGTVRMFLEVRDSNEPARSLYASRGFEEVGRRKSYYRRPVEDALILRRTAKMPPHVEKNVTRSK
jgi:ribosomal-protein-alanine N-acetyltransferase